MLLPGLDVFVALRVVVDDLQLDALVGEAAVLERAADAQAVVGAVLEPELELENEVGELLVEEEIPAALGRNDGVPSWTR